MFSIALALILFAVGNAIAIKRVEAGKLSPVKLMRFIALSAMVLTICVIVIGRDVCDWLPVVVKARFTSDIVVAPGTEKADDSDSLVVLRRLNDGDAYEFVVQNADGTYTRHWLHDDEFTHIFYLNGSHNRGTWQRNVLGHDHSGLLAKFSLGDYFVQYYDTLILPATDSHPAGDCSGFGC